MPTFAFPGPKTAAPAASDAARLSELEKYTARLVDYLRFLLSSLDAENLDVDGMDVESILRETEAQIDRELKK